MHQTIYGMLIKEFVKEHGEKKNHFIYQAIEIGELGRNQQKHSHV